MRDLLVVAALVNSVFINGQGNMVAESRRINICILLTNHKLLSIDSESVPRRGSKASIYSYAEKIYQSVKNAGVASVKRANERNESFGKKKANSNV